MKQAKADKKQGAVPQPPQGKHSAKREQRQGNRQLLQRQRAVNCANATSCGHRQHIGQWPAERPPECASRQPDRNHEKQMVKAEYRMRQTGKHPVRQGFHRHAAQWMMRPRGAGQQEGTKDQGDSLHFKSPLCVAWIKPEVCGSVKPYDFAAKPQYLVDNYAVHRPP